MGDVALTVPVLAGMRQQYPDAEIVMLTKESFRPFFRAVKGITFFHPDLKNRHKGIRGIYGLCRDITNAGRIDCVIDLHDVIRTKVLRAFFMLAGVKCHVIDKGKKQKKAVIRGKTREMLPHTVERYCSVFAGASFPVKVPEGPWIIPSVKDLEKADSLLSEDGKLHIGVAPFAKHALKRWPVDYMVTLLGMIGAKYKTCFWLFGGSDEKEKLEDLSRRIDNSRVIPADFSLGEEIAVMSRLSLMIAMDSSNMHMAALTGTRTVSVWGGTDRINGFGAWGQPDSNFVAIPFEELPCRPCTVYGKGKCRRGDLACMMWLTPEKVFDRIDRVLGGS